MKNILILILILSSACSKKGESPHEFMSENIPTPIVDSPNPETPNPNPSPVYPSNPLRCQYNYRGTSSEFISCSGSNIPSSQGYTLDLFKQFIGVWPTGCTGASFLGEHELIENTPYGVTLRARVCLFCSGNYRCQDIEQNVTIVNFQGVLE